MDMSPDPDSSSTRNGDHGEFLRLKRTNDVGLYRSHIDNHLNYERKKRLIDMFHMSNISPWKKMLAS